MIQKYYVKQYKNLMLRCSTACSLQCCLFGHDDVFVWVLTELEEVN